LWKNLSEINTIPIIIIIECSQCGGLLLAIEKQKTKSCTYCGARIKIHKAIRIASAGNSYEASKKLKNYKEKKGFNKK